jgi:hypothetical protein
MMKYEIRDWVGANQILYVHASERLVVVVPLSVFKGTLVQKRSLGLCRSGSFDKENIYYFQSALVIYVMLHACTPQIHVHENFRIHGIFCICCITWCTYINFLTLLGHFLKMCQNLSLIQIRVYASYASLLLVVCYMYVCILGLRYCEYKLA